MSFRNRFAAITAAATLSASLTYAVIASAAYKFAGNQGVEFDAKGPAGMMIYGTSSDLEAKDDGGTLTFSASLKNLNTDEPTGLRDKHLRKYLEVEKEGYGAATLVVEASKINLPQDSKESNGDATGKFTLHGVTKDQKFNYKIKRTGSDYHVRANFKVNITNHKIEQPCYSKICVEPEIVVRVKFKLRDKG